MGTTHHNVLTGSDLHAPQAHKDSHNAGDSDALDFTGAKILVGDTSDITGLSAEVQTKGISTKNLIRNGQFRFWKNGSGSSPDFWTAQSHCNVYRSGAQVKGYLYAARLRNDAGFVTTFTTSGYWANATQCRELFGEYVTFSAWVYTTNVEDIYISIYDYAGSWNNVNSSNHTGSGWELLTVTKQIRDATSQVVFKLALNTNNAVTVYLDNAVVTKGSIPFIYNEHTFDLVTKYNTDVPRYGVDASGSANTLTAAINYVGTITAGNIFYIKVANSTTGSSTLNVSSTTAYAVKTVDGNDTTTDTLLANNIYPFIYDGTNWVILGRTVKIDQTIIMSPAEIAAGMTKDAALPGRIKIAGTQTAYANAGVTDDYLIPLRFPSISDDQFIILNQITMYFTTVANGDNFDWKVKSFNISDGTLADVSTGIEAGLGGIGYNSQVCLSSDETISSNLIYYLEISNEDTGADDDIQWTGIKIEYEIIT